MVFIKASLYNLLCLAQVLPALPLANGSKGCLLLQYKCKQWSINNNPIRESVVIIMVIKVYTNDTN